MSATIASAAQSIVSPLAAVIRRALPRSFAAAAAILLMAFASPFFSCDRLASAADTSPQLRTWVVEELRGAAFTHPGGSADAQWQPLQAGARVAPGSVVRTDASGSMELQNGIDTIRLSPSSEIELPAGQSGDPVTRVIHWVGTAFFHVGKRPGPQFEVDTPYIVAIVKGTKFTTIVSKAGAAIKVSEGIVGVSATSGGSSIDVTAGGSASVSAAHSDTVTPGGPSGDADPAGSGDGVAPATSGSNTSGGADVEAGAVSSAGGALSGGADDPADGSDAGATKGGNGNGHDDSESDGNSTVIGNGDGQGGVDSSGDDGDHGGGGGHGHHGSHHHHHHHQGDHHGHSGHRH